jgi:hypothetical protein
LLACGGDDSGADTTSATTTEAATTDGEPTTGIADSTGDPAVTSSGDSTGGSSGDGSGGDSTGDSSGESTGAAAPTWAGFGAAFFETYCWECHGPGDALRDYSVLENVMAESASIRCGTSSPSNPAPDCAGEPPAGQFPIGDNLPTDEERDMLVEWIDAGLPAG